jgi:uncharacterized membrane protein YhfC
MSLLLARAVGVLILVLGAKGAIAPADFVETVTFFQSPPMLYIAAVVRVAVGVVLIVAAPASRAPVLVRALGVLITIGGLLTPFMGTDIARPILDWWATGLLIPRIFGIVAIGLGILVLYATRRRGTADQGPGTKDLT